MTTISRRTAAVVLGLSATLVAGSTAAIAAPPASHPVHHKSGKFAKDWVKEYQGGYKRYNALLKAGVYVNIALPPGTPNKLCLLRCSVSAAHSDADLDRIIELFGKVVAQGHGKKVVNG